MNVRNPTLRDAFSLRLLHAAWDIESPIFFSGGETWYFEGLRTRVYYVLLVFGEACVGRRE